ncbi:hypothetical protein B7463_g5414, partial [Scytalidium lignicola]
MQRLTLKFPPLPIDKTNLQFCLFPCPNGEWCCNTYPNCDNNCCSDSSFTLAAVGSPTGVSAPTTSVSTQTVSKTTTITRTEVRSGTPTATPTPTDEISAEETSETACPACKKSDTMPIGVGVGVSLGVAFVSALAASIILFGRLRALQKSRASTDPLLKSATELPPTRYHSELPADQERFSELPGQGSKVGGRWS